MLKYKKCQNNKRHAFICILGQPEGGSSTSSSSKIHQTNERKTYNWPHFLTFTKYSPICTNIDFYLTTTSELCILGRNIIFFKITKHTKQQTKKKKDQNMPLFNKYTQNAQHTQKTTYNIGTAHISTFLQQTHPFMVDKVREWLIGWTTNPLLPGARVRIPSLSYFLFTSTKTIQSPLFHSSASNHHLH